MRKVFSFKVSMAMVAHEGRGRWFATRALQAFTGRCKSLQIFSQGPGTEWQSPQACRGGFSGQFPTTRTGFEMPLFTWPAGTWRAAEVT